MEVHDTPEEEKDALRQMAEGEFKVNDKQKRLMEYITANLNIEDFMNCLSEEMWLREVLKDVASPKPFVRMKALSMWGQYMGFLGKKKGKNELPKQVEFE